MTAKDDAAREAAVFDGMLPGWYKHYGLQHHVRIPHVDSLWEIILLRRETELVEHLAREICQRLLNDAREGLVKFDGGNRQAANTQQGVRQDAKE